MNTITQNKPDSQFNLGIDIGRVIMAPVTNGKADTSFLSGNIEQAMKTPPSPNAIASVSRLVELFDGRVWLVSKAGKSTQHKTRIWLDYLNFYSQTGLNRGNIRFCFKRHQKADHCRELEITHFIDDRIDVLRHLWNLVPNCYLFGEQPKLNVIPDWVSHVNNWKETVELVEANIDCTKNISPSISSNATR